MEVGLEAFDHPYRYRRVVLCSQSLGRAGPRGDIRWIWLRGDQIEKTRPGAPGREGPMKMPILRSMAVLGTTITYTTKMPAPPNTAREHPGIASRAPADCEGDPTVD